MELKKYPAGSWSIESGAEAAAFRQDSRWILGEKEERSGGWTVGIGSEGDLCWKGLGFRVLRLDEEGGLGFGRGETLILAFWEVRRVRGQGLGFDGFLGGVAEM